MEWEIEEAKIYSYLDDCKRITLIAIPFFVTPNLAQQNDSPQS